MTVFPKLQQFLFPKYDSEEVRRHIDDYNVRFTFIASVIAFAASCALIVLKDKNIIVDSIPYMPVRTFYSVFILTQIVVMLLSVFYLSGILKKHAAAHLITGAFGIAYAVFGIAVSIVYYAHGNQILPFVSVAIFASSVLVLAPAAAIAGISGAFTAFLLMVGLEHGMTYKLLMNIMLIWSMCIFVSINRFYYRVSTLSQSERLKKLNAELEMISKYDALTEIRNRYSLRGDFNAYIGKRIFLMMSDIDNFKNFNDQRGHDIGDKVLLRFAKILSESFTKDSCYRYGGDEFLIIKPFDSKETFESCLVNCCRLMNDIQLDEEAVPFSFSGGYTYGYAAAHEDIRAMMKQADEYLYKVKRHGKHNILGGEYGKGIEHSIAADEADKYDVQRKKES